jgi:hypothetical protein
MRGVVAAICVHVEAITPPLVCPSP